MEVIGEVVGSMDQLRDIVLAIISVFFGLLLVGIAMTVGAKYVRRAGMAGAPGGGDFDDGYDYAPDEWDGSGPSMRVMRDDERF
jgi:hypothetical protein